MKVNFRDTSPQYDIQSSAWDEERLTALGCSEALIRELLKFHRTNTDPLQRPEDWFWIDPPKGVVNRFLEEMFCIAGGSFVSLPLDAQCALLSMEVIELPMLRCQSGRGRWLADDGRAYSIEQAALKELMAADQAGYSCEGKMLSAVITLTNQVFREQSGNDLFIKYPNHLNYPLESDTDQFMSCLDKVVASPAECYKKHRGIMARLYSFGPSDIESYASRAAPLFLRSMVALHLRRRCSIRGHLDLTIFHEAGCSFIEVKSSADRLRGAQACWIRNVARPLNLFVSLAHVSSHR